MPLDLKNLDTTALGTYLKRIGALGQNDRLLKIEKAGEGNMNVALRAISLENSLIVKQANPYVEKYPSIPAPVERAEMEAAFFKEANTIKGLAEMLPALIHLDTENHIQVIEDLGKGKDLTGFYEENNEMHNKDITTLVGFLKSLHAHRPINAIENREMRKLNHAHIFEIPFQRENGLDFDSIQPALGKLAEETIFSSDYPANVAHQLGAVYLSQASGPLLHGDFFPGSWLQTENGIKVIDPEFCFNGPAEFDLGVFMAHLRFCGVGNSEIKTHIQAYGNFDEGLAFAFMSTEILRRLFGVAQLPLKHGIDSKKSLSHEALKILSNYSPN